MQRLDGLLDRLQRDDRRVAVFGLNEVYGLARTYSTLGTFPVCCGLVDEPQRAEYAGLGFPVVRPEEYSRHLIQDVILAVNKIYREQVVRRFETCDVVLHNVLH
jgi:hypothetical protein